MTRIPTAAVELVRRIADSSDAEIVIALAAAGLVTRASQPFDFAAIRHIRTSTVFSDHERFSGYPQRSAAVHALA